VICDRRKLYKC